MGQGEILEVLEESKVPLAIREMARMMDEAEEKIAHTLRRMLKYGDVKCVELNKDLAMKFFKCKRRLRLYYL